MSAQPTLTRRQLALATAATGLAAAPIAISGGALAAGEDEAAIRANIETFRKATIAKDTKTLGDLVAESLSYGHSAGRIENKQQFLANLAANKAVTKVLNYPDIVVQVNGPSAIVRHIWESESELDGKTNKIRIGVMQVWQKGADGKWRIYARQAHIFPPKT
jgi:uncharacterized protein (TIGR02246 family)